MSIEVIAEIGVNHNGDMATARALIDAAAGAGCAVAKFQVWNTERVYAGDDAKVYGPLELSRTSLRQLATYCIERGIEFMATPDEIDDATFLVDLGVSRIKTSSQDVTNLPFLASVAKLGLPVIFSTGACTWVELLKGANTLLEHNPYVTILHCVSAYPAPLWEMNLRVITAIKETFRKTVGLSDHTVDVFAAICALPLGATVFEKHVTLDRRQHGPDHRASLEPHQLAAYVAALKNASFALGDGIKRVMPCELPARERNLHFIAPRLRGER